MIGAQPTEGLEGLLTSFEEAGQLESRGAFTLAGKRAAGKLARALLPEPSDWILKVVQSACKAKAPDLRISQTGKATHISYAFPFALDLRAFELSLTTAQAASQPGVEELATALRVVGLGQDRSWVAKVVLGQTVHWIVVNEGEVHLETSHELDPKVETTELLLGIAYPPGQVGKLGGLLRFGAAIQNEHEALLTRGRACPVPLYLDDKRLDDMARSDGLANIESEVFLGVAIGQSQEGVAPISWPQALKISPHTPFGDRFLDSQPFVLPTQSGSVSSGSSLLRVAFRFQKETFSTRGRGSRLRTLATSSRVVLVRYGVVVGRRNLGITEPVAVDVYLNADELPANLSGLEAEILPQQIELAKSQLAELGPFLDSVRSALVSHRGRPSRSDWLLGAGVASGSALLFYPWPAKLLGLAAAVIQLTASGQRLSGMVSECAREVERFSSVYCSTPRPTPEKA